MRAAAYARAVEQLCEASLDLRANEPAMLAELEALEQPAARVVLDRAPPQPEELAYLGGREEVPALERAVAPGVAGRGGAQVVPSSSRFERRCFAELGLLWEALRALSRYGEHHQRLWEIDERVRAFSEGPLGYLIEPLRLGVALEVIDLVEEDGEAALLDLLETAVRDEQLIGGLRAAISDVTLLSDSKRRRLDHALEHLAAGEYLFVIDTLIAVVEGFFWAIASEREVIDERDHFTPVSGFHGVARGLAEASRAVGISGGFHTFLVHRSYGGRGHPFRHGRADEGEREQVLVLMVALAGWLETFAGIPARRWLMAALERDLGSRTLVGSGLTALDARGNELSPRAGVTR
ncbi:MAG: hypothetical protein M3088_04570 [Actinomycetota bacterium]|nr:hypothetical protein [Actinomycetota bacterium]